MTEINELISGTIRQVSGLLGQMVWAEEEIEAAQKRHPDAADLLDGSFRLLVPTHGLMETEFVYRGHARELLERVAGGQDTRAATWAEILCLCHDVSQVVPFHSAAAGLYFRAWVNAFPQLALPDQIDRGHYEALYSQQIDGLESESRRKLAVADRRLVR